MDIETYKARIGDLDTQINNIKKEINEIEHQIEEAQAAKNSAKKVRNEFNAVVDRRRVRINRPIKGMHLKSVRSFLRKVKSLLNGSDYRKTSALIDEMSSAIEQKLKCYEENLDYSRDELRRLQRLREQLVGEYNMAILACNSEDG